MQDETEDLCLEDRARIQDVIHRWCRAVDRRDWPLVRGCFHDDAEDDHVFYRGGVDGLVACLEERHRRILCSVHAVSNLLYRFEGTDVARVESYVRVMQRRPVDPAALPEADAAAGHDSQVSEVYCRYLDRFERRQGLWRIARRLLVIDSAREYTEREPRHRLPEAGSASLGRRDRTDAVYRWQ